MSTTAVRTFASGGDMVRKFSSPQPTVADADQTMNVEGSNVGLTDSDRRLSRSPRAL